MNVVGLTGGVATGKTTVTHYFKNLNIPIIDADAINYQLLQPKQSGYTAILNLFPDVPLLKDSTLDKAYLRHKIFSDSDNKHQLECLLHPIIKQKIMSQIQSLKLNSQSSYCIVSVPLLIEAKFNDLMEEIWITDCSEETQIKRLMLRDQISNADAKLIMANQLTRQARLKYADKIINTENHEAMNICLDNLHKRQINMNSK